MPTRVITANARYASGTVDIVETPDGPVGNGRVCHPNTAKYNRAFIEDGGGRQYIGTITS